MKGGRSEGKKKVLVAGEGAPGGRRGRRWVSSTGDMLQDGHVVQVRPEGVGAVARDSVGAKELLEFFGAQAVGFGEDVREGMGLGNVSRGADVDEVDRDGVERVVVEGCRSAVAALPVTQPGVVEEGVGVGIGFACLGLCVFVGEHGCFEERQFLRGFYVILLILVCAYI